MFGTQRLSSLDNFTMFECSALTGTQGLDNFNGGVFGTPRALLASTQFTLRALSALIRFVGVVDVGDDVDDETD